MGAACTSPTLLELDDLVEVLILEQEREGQVTSHISIGLISTLLSQPALVLKPIPLLILELLVELEEPRVVSLLSLLTELQIVARFILIDVDVQVGPLDESGASLGRFEIENKSVLRHRQLDLIAQCLLLGLKCDYVQHHCILQMVHIPLLILGELLDKPLERLSCFSLGRARAPSKELSDTILQNLIYEVLVTKRFLFLRVLSDDAHDLTETVRVVDRHFDSCQRLSFVQEQIDVSSHLLLLLAFHGHDLDLLRFEFLVVTRVWRFHEQHVVDLSWRLGK